VDSEDKHWIGYWMTVFGAAVVIVTGIFGSFINLGRNMVYTAVLAGLILFFVGAELALRNQRHQEHFP